MSALGIVVVDSEVSEDSQSRATRCALGVFTSACEESAARAKHFWRQCDNCHQWSTKRPLDVPNVKVVMGGGYSPDGEPRFQFHYTWGRSECGKCDDLTHCEHCRNEGRESCTCGPTAEYPDYQTKGLSLPPHFGTTYKTRRTTQLTYVVLAAKCPQCQRSISVDRKDQLSDQLGAAAGCRECCSWQQAFPDEQAVDDAFRKDPACEEFCWTAGNRWHQWLPQNLQLFPAGLHQGLLQANQHLGAALRDHENPQKRDKKAEGGEGSPAGAKRRKHAASSDGGSVNSSEYLDLRPSTTINKFGRQCQFLRASSAPSPPPEPYQRQWHHHPNHQQQPGAGKGGMRLLQPAASWGSAGEGGADEVVPLPAWPSKEGVWWQPSRSGAGTGASGEQQVPCHSVEQPPLHQQPQQPPAASQQQQEEQHQQHQPAALEFSADEQGSGGVSSSAASRPACGARPLPEAKPAAQAPPASRYRHYPSWRKPLPRLC